MAALPPAALPPAFLTTEEVLVLSITIHIAMFILMYIARFSYRYPYRDLFIAFLKSLWSACNLSEHMVLLAIFMESFCASRFARKVFVACS